MNRSIAGVEYARGWPHPICQLVVEQRPSINSPLGRKAYQEAVRNEAGRIVTTPLTAHDLEVEIYYVGGQGINIDLDNIVHPTLNALSGSAFLDDRQVRSLRIVGFDMTRGFRFQGNIALAASLLAGRPDHRVVILIYSEQEWMASLRADADAQRTQRETDGGHRPLESP